ncbi:hypothetical protein WG908_05215 [Sphingobium sp. AN641]|uniref:hypothetical protein n=1 Tax=Sphingobium sp. AN641 TaxID=3133443 RepID=UPI0030C2876D
MIRSRLLPSLALLLSGCVGAQGGYPSLAKRPIEGAPMAQPAPVVAPPVAADPALAQEVARYAAQAQAGQSAFDARLDAADRAARAAAGAGVSSEAWVVAQQAISALEQARNDSVSALASLDVLYVARANAEADGKAVAGGMDAIDTERAAALAMVDAQNDRIDALKARLAQP